MWTDNETAVDFLGFKVHAELIRSVVIDKNLLPVTLGVFADWGGGKTSLMRMLEESLDPEKWPNDSKEQKSCEKVVCLYFNGWQFEGYDDAKSAILTSVLTSMGEHKRFGPKFRDGCTSLLKSVNWMRVAHMGFKNVALPAIAAYATGGASLLPTFITSMAGYLPIPGMQQSPPPVSQPGQQQTAPQSNNSATTKEEVNWEDLLNKDKSPASPLDVRTFRDKFAKLLKDTDIDSLVVLIDDLDRCSPERIVENLEAIKLFLNVEKTAFVIGADPRIVRHSIAWKYKRFEDNVSIEDESTIINDYLEKLIQFPYRLPKLSPAEIETYMALLFCQAHLDEKVFTSTIAACDAQRAKDRYSVFSYSSIQAALKTGSGNSIPEGLDKALAFTASAAPLITEGLKGNPRQVKRFLNAFVLRKKLAEVANLSNIKDSVLVKLMILEYSNEPKFRELYDWQAASKGLPQQIEQLEKSVKEKPSRKKTSDAESKNSIPEGWATPNLTRWLNMEPSLIGEDLGDYFWIARDRLQSSISGMSLVPPLVRRVFENLLSEVGGLRTEAATSASKFDELERAVLFELAMRNIKQNAEKKSGYDAFRALIESDIDGAAQHLASVMREVPANAIPAAVGGDILTLIKSKPELQTVFEALIEELAKSDTHVGRMIKQLSKLK